MSDDVKWIISSSGINMFARFSNNFNSVSSTGFLAKIHYGKEILDQTLL